MEPGGGTQETGGLGPDDPTDARVSAPDGKPVLYPQAARVLFRIVMKRVRLTGKVMLRGRRRDDERE